MASQQIDILFLTNRISSSCKPTVSYSLQQSILKRYFSNAT